MTDTTHEAVEQLIERMRVAYGGALSRDCTAAFRALLARVEAAETRADIDQSAYEELLRAKEAAEAERDALIEAGDLMADSIESGMYGGDVVTNWDNTRVKWSNK